MIDLDFIERLIRTVDGSTVDHVEIERGGTRIRIAKTPPSAPGAPGSAASTSGEQASPPAVPGQGNSPGPAARPESTPAAGEGEGPEDLLEVTSPMVGTFYRASSPGADPFTDVGKRISKGDILCIIEAMKLMNELESEVDGTVREVCVDNGEPVEYGQILFRVQPV